MAELVKMLEWGLCKVHCILDIQSWMIDDRLLIYDEKTEMLLTFIEKWYQLKKLNRKICLRNSDNAITLLPLLEM